VVAVIVSKCSTPIDVISTWRVATRDIVKVLYKDENHQAEQGTGISCSTNAPDKSATPTPV